MAHFKCRCFFTPLATTVCQWLILTVCLLPFSTKATASTASGTNPSVANVNGSNRSNDQLVFIRKPVWELGLGAASFSGHDYPASDDQNQAGIALPFFIYRSEVIRLEGRGVGAVAYERPRIKLDLSLGGSLSAESEGNAARAGMPDLDFLFELGPRLNILLSRKLHTDGGTSTIRWLNSFRGVVSSDFASLAGRGFLFKTELEFKRKRLLGTGFDFQFQLDSTWATQELHDYFYTVAAEFETPGRRRFEAGSGYLSSTLTAGFGYKITPALRIFTAIALESFSGAANERSPLFETDSNVTLATAIVWTARSSRRQIDVFEDD